MIKRAQTFTWEGVDILPYKEDSSLFKAITRQVLFRGENDLNVELRYFEVQPGGHSTLERHEHQHAVTIIRGGGRCLVGNEVHAIGLHDVVTVPPMTWHQFRAIGEEPLGFLCVVANDRDRPQRPDADQLAELQSDPTIAEFIRY